MYIFVREELPVHIISPSWASAYTIVSWFTVSDIISAAERDLETNNLFGCLAKCIQNLLMTFLAFFR